MSEPARNPEPDTRITGGAIIAACACRTKVSFALMQAPLRIQRVTRARHLTWIVLRTLRPDLSFPTLGRWFCRDHTTVCVAVNRHAGRVGPDDIAAIEADARERDRQEVTP